VEVMAGEKLIRASDARKAILNIDPRIAYCIDSVPAVDAVEVVRCKDCKHGDFLGYSEGLLYCMKHSCYMDEDDFCSDGERG
jgi:hypothetical protein